MFLSSPTLADPSAEEDYPWGQSGGINAGLILLQPDYYVFQQMLSEASCRFFCGEPNSQYAKEMASILVGKRCLSLSCQTRQVFIFERDEFTFHYELLEEE